MAQRAAPDISLLATMITVVKTKRELENK